MKHYYIFVRLIIVVSFGLISSFVFASDSLVAIEKYLHKVKESSLQIKISDNESQSNLVLNNKNRLIFEPSGYASASYLSENSPPKSPFSTSKVRDYEYEIGVNKLWQGGISTNLSYGLSNISNSFFSGNENNYLLPKLQLTLTSNLVQDLVYRRYDNLEKEIANSAQAIKMESNISRKKLLIQSLLDLSSLLEIEDEQILQTSLCKETEVQVQKLKQKRKRGSVSNRDYYLSLRESTVCQATVGQLEKKKIEAEKELEVIYSLNISTLSSLKIVKIFNELKQYYSQKKEKASSPFNLEDNDEVKYISYVLSSAKAKQEKLRALSKSNLSLEVAAGATGLNESFDRANEDLGKMSYPFVYVGVNIDLPWEDRGARAESSANLFKLRAIEQEEKLTRSRVLERFETLNSTLEKDFFIYQKYLRSLSLSQKIINEARKDFINGRIDFYTLTEFNKRLIQDQKSLSSYRIQLIIRMVAFLDFHNYFDKYLGK